MATKKAAARKKTTRKKAKPAPAPLTAEQRATHFEIEQGLKILTKTISELQKGLKGAEREIEADARRKIAALKKEGRAQLDVINAKSKEITASLRKATSAAETSWEDLKRSAETLIGEARSTAVNFADRIRNMLPR